MINLLGRLHLEPAVSPFEMAPDLVAAARARTPVVLVDFHAEATSEKVAMGRLLDGVATAVVGTHTHVQTNDATVLPGGTAYLTDAGMTGPHDSVIGVRSDLILPRFRTGLPARFEPAEGDVRIEGAADRVRRGRPRHLDRDVQAARIGRLSCSGPAPSRGSSRPEQHQRQPPADVRIEPVAGHHLGGQHRGRRQRRDRGGVLAAARQHGQQHQPEPDRDLRGLLEPAQVGPARVVAGSVQIDSGVTRSSW